MKNKFFLFLVAKIIFTTITYLIFGFIVASKSFAGGFTSCDTGNTVSNCPVSYPMMQVGYPSYDSPGKVVFKCSTEQNAPELNNGVPVIHECHGGEIGTFGGNDLCDMSNGAPGDIADLLHGTCGCLVTDVQQMFHISNTDIIGGIAKLPASVCSNKCVQDIGQPFNVVTADNGSMTNCFTNDPGDDFKYCYFNAHQNGDVCSNSVAQDGNGVDMPGSGTGGGTGSCPTGQIPDTVNGGCKTDPNAGGGNNGGGSTSCPSGQVLDGTGSCVADNGASTNCSAGYSYNTTTHQCTANGGGSGGNGNGNSNGACDPTSSNYLSCIGTSGNPTHTFAQHCTTSSQCYGNFVTGLRNTNIGKLANVGSSLSSGSCPAPSFVIFNRSYTLDAHCILFDQISGLLTAASDIAFVAAGILIILSA